MTIAMNKVRKSFLKRFKITKKGKILRRIAGQNHFLAKKSSAVLKRKKKLKLAPREFLSYKEY
jgi:ribosomal protein L35